MRKQKSASKKIRDMVEAGVATKTIVERLGVKPRTVYNVRYQLNRRKGLGALPVTTTAKPTATVTPIKTVRKVRAGTGITPAPLPVQPGEFKELPITMVQPTLWQRVVRFFKGA